MFAQRRSLPFWKYEALGNDFILLDNLPAGGDWHSGKLSIAAPNRETVQWLCNRRLGIGADGVLVIEAPSISARRGGAMVRMRVFNADGSEAETCGNGLRCVVRHLVEEVGGVGSGVGAADAGRVVVETGAGPNECRVVSRDDSLYWVRVGLGQPIFLPGSASLAVRGSIEAARVLDNVDFDVSCLSMGNPHCVVVGAEPEELDELASVVAGRHEIFPDGCNVSAAKVAGKSILELRVFERGVGPTPACGSGAAAAVAAACKNGLFLPGEKIRVLQPGGRLDVVVSPDYSDVAIEGPVNRVFTGTVDLPSGMEL